MRKIALLRGINVGNIRIKMSDLQLAFETLAYRDVSTILATGNVLFTSESSLETCKANIQKKLSETFHYEAFAQIFDNDKISQTLAICNLEEFEDSHLYFIFVETPAIMDLLKIAAKNLKSTEIQFGDDVIFWKVLKGETLLTPFSKEIAKAKYKPFTTMRNIQTIRKLVD